MESMWMSWVRKLQSIAQAGLSYSKDEHDLGRFRQVQKIAAEIAAHATDGDLKKISKLFHAEIGYATPKIDVRAAVFNKKGELLLVREKVDENKWTLPGGWGDVECSPSENTEREVLEESGLTVKARKLAAVYDRNLHGYTPHSWHSYKIFFICDVVGGELSSTLETSEAKFFTEEELPLEDEISVGRSRLKHIRRMFEHYHKPDLPTDFD